MNTIMSVKHSNASKETHPDIEMGDVDDGEEVFEGSELDSLLTSSSDAMISCIQTTSGVCSLVSLWLIL